MTLSLSEKKRLLASMGEAVMQAYACFQKDSVSADGTVHLPIPERFQMAKKSAHVFSTLPDMPAFPLDPGTGADDPYNGITKREYFAAYALAGLLSSLSPTDDSATLCPLAVKTADALIAALNMPASMQQLISRDDDSDNDGAQ